MVWNLLVYQRIEQKMNDWLVGIKMEVRFYFNIYLVKFITKSDPRNASSTKWAALNSAPGKAQIFHARQVFDHLLLCTLISFNYAYLYFSILVLVFSPASGYRTFPPLASKSRISLKYWPSMMLSKALA